MKELLVLSGKGGAGKTSITACFAQLARNAVFVDCDVDASNLPMLLTPSDTHTEEFRAGQIPVVDPGKCSGCGACAALCRFHAVTVENGSARVADSCEGCGVCSDHCPEGAITLSDRVCGELCVSETGYGMLYHAALRPGAENSGKLIASLRKLAREKAEKAGADWIISDGPPGIGCPVISAATGVDHAVVVTEPSVSGIHDMQRLASLLKQFEIPFALLINKWDINPGKTEETERWCERNHIPVLGRIPFDETFSRALQQRKTILDCPGSPSDSILRQCWERLQKYIAME